MFEIIMLSGFLYAATSQMRLRKPESSQRNDKRSQRRNHVRRKKDGQSRKGRLNRPKQKPCEEMIAA